MNTTSFLKIQLRKIESSLIHQGEMYSINIKINTEEIPLLKGQTYSSTQGEILINQTFIFALANQKIKRNSICFIEIWYKDQNALSFFGEVHFLVMDYKNYSKKIFQLSKGHDQNAFLQMNTNISFTRPSQTNDLKIRSSRKQIKNHLITPIKLEFDLRDSSSVDEPQIVSNQIALILAKDVQTDIKMNQSIKNHPKFNIKMSQSITQHLQLPISEVKILLPHDQQKQAKSSLSIFEKSGIVIKTKQEIQKQQQKSPNNLKFTVEPKSDKKNNFLRIPEIKNLASSCRLTGSQNGADSRYCKDIQLNLNNLSILENQAIMLSKTRSPMKNQENKDQIYNTLRIMKSKFQKIQQKEAILNNEYEFDQLMGQNQKSDQINGKQSHNQLKRSFNPILNDHSYNSIDRPQNSFINNFIHNKYLYLNQTVNVMIKSKNVHMKKKMKTQRTVNIKYSSKSPKLLKQEDVHQQRSKSLWSAIYHIPSKPAREGEIKEQPQNSYLRNTYKKFDLEEEKLQKMNFIKLRKITYHQQAADIARRKNTFLILANDQMFAAQQRLDQKLDISKKIIAEKEDVLNHQFQKLQSQIGDISKKLSETNSEAKIRQEKIVNLQNQIETYSRQNNQLKTDMKLQLKIIQQLRIVLAETQQKTTQQADTGKYPPVTSIKTIVEKQPKTSRSLYQKGYSKQKISNIPTTQKRSNSGSKPLTERQFKLSKHNNSTNRIEPFQINDGTPKPPLQFQRFRYGKSESFHLDIVNNLADKYVNSKLAQYTPRDLTKRNHY